MPNIRIKDIPTTASATSSNDFIAIDGATNGTRKLSANSPVFAGNVTAPDYILGTSGPSVRSSLGAKAPRQGLVFDGTGWGSIASNAPTLGLTAFTAGAWVLVNSLSAAQAIIGGENTGSFGLRVQTNGTITAHTTLSGSPLTSTGTVVAGKTSLVLYSRDASGNGTFYINGIAAGTVSDSRNYSAASDAIGNVFRTAANSTLSGSLSPLIYNRALSATEIVSLYESSAPSGADYSGTAAGTALNSSAFVQESGLNFDSFSGASTSGFTAGVTSTSGARIIQSRAAFAVRKDNTIRVTFTATQNSGTIGAIFLVLRTAAGSNISASGAPVVAGSNTYSLTATSAASDATVAFVRGNGGAVVDFTIASFAATPLGLLLAPDAQQNGGGLVWYDTSGNAANITLPASGVRWGNPFAGFITAPTTTNLTLAGGSSGASLVLGQGANALATVTPSGTGRLLVDKTNAANDAIQSGLGINFGADGTLGALSFTVRGFPSATGGSRYVTIGASDGGNVRRLVVGADGSGNFSNVLFGTVTDSANGRLQLADHTTSAGGIGFGTDVTLYRSAANVLKTDDALIVASATASTSTTTGALTVAGGVGVAGRLNTGGDVNVLQSAAATEATLTVRTNSISIGSRAAPLYSQLYFRGYDGIGNSAGTLKAAIRMGDMGSNTLASILSFWNNDQSGVHAERARFDEFGNLLIGGTTNSTGTGGLKVFGTTASTSTTTGALQVVGGAGIGGALFTGGAVTTSAPTGGAGAWELGVANTVTPTAPNRTITIEIGGTVYYLHAKTTND